MRNARLLHRKLLHHRSETGGCPFGGFGLFATLRSSSCNARDFKDKFVVDQSIDAGLAWTEEELAILVTLAVQSGLLAVLVFSISTAHEGVTE